MLQSARVTVVIPTYNRASMLRESLTSVLAQGVDGMVVLVNDNASTDDTSSVVSEFDDDRIVYRRNDENIGFFPNWQYGLAAATSPYVAVLQDDDRWRPGFLAAAVEVLEQTPVASAAFSDVEFIGDEGQTIGNRQVELPIGTFSGLDYLEAVVRGCNVVIDSSAMLMRTKVFNQVGGLDFPHMTHDVIFNYQFRLSRNHDLVHLSEPLAEIRHHPGQIHHGDRQAAAAAGMVAERMDAAAFLLGSTRADDPTYRHWLAERLIWLGRLRSHYTAEAVSGLTLPAEDRLDLAAADILAATDSDDGQPVAVALVGDDLADHPTLFEARRLQVIPQIDGCYGGAPPSSAQLIDEVRRLSLDGVRFLAVAWPSFWWIDYYHEFRDFLDGYDRVVDNSRAVVVDLGDMP
jgi:glycosyltransferase involved in cell wall biosynthesis